MYVEDIDDLDELAQLRDEAVRELDVHPANEQAQFDLEDIDQRIAQVKAESASG
ncbi:hypothetical protein SEA_ZIMMER_75 [Mycobacterium phage Zimmer]|nr:hypothetical protein SEA_ZIMMER_75 [Mycobacterium phage Zimmer]